MELLIARNPDPDSRLPYLLLLPLAGGMVFRTSGTWPRTSALYCYPVSADEWPEAPTSSNEQAFGPVSAGGPPSTSSSTEGGRLAPRSASPGPVAATLSSGSPRAPASALLGNILAGQRLTPTGWSSVPPFSAKRR